MTPLSGYGVDKGEALKAPEGHTPGPWVSETEVVHDGDHGLAVIAVDPAIPPGATPTRGMVCWVHAGLGAAITDDAAIANARLIAAAPDLVTALSAAKGYMLNAVIDLQTGTKKSTTEATLNGGIKMIDAALAKALP